MLKRQGVPKEQKLGQVIIHINILYEPGPSKIHYFLYYLDFLPVCPIWTVWGKSERFQQKLNGNLAINMPHLLRAPVSLFFVIDLQDQQCLPDWISWIGDGTVQEPFAKFSGLDSNRHGLTGWHGWLCQWNPHHSMSHSLKWKRKVDQSQRMGDKSHNKYSKDSMKPGNCRH